MENKFPENIMEILRQRRDLEYVDTSEDEVINTYSAKMALDEVVGWELGGGWASTIIDWVEDIYQIELKEKGTE